MNALRLWWQALSMRIDSLSFRERLLVFAASLGGLLAVLYVGLIEPALARQRVMQQTTADLATELASLRERTTAAERAGAPDPAQEAARLAADTAALEQEITGLQSRMRHPAQTIALLRALLAEQPQLTLLELSTAPAQPALATPADASAQPAPPPAVEFFKHAITVRVAGSYADLTAYLARLEQMPWTVRWESVRIDATRHPVLELTLHLDSLSREATWSQL